MSICIKSDGVKIPQLFWLAILPQTSIYNWCILFFKIYPILVYHIKIYVHAAVNHNKFY